MTRGRSTTRRQLLADALLGAGALSLSTTCASPVAVGISAASGTPPTGDAHDFDFLVGEWQGANRQLTRRWSGSDTWDVFPATLRCERRLGGIVIITELDLPTKGISGITVRTFDRDTRRWSGYWINRKTGKLAPPVVGGFTGDRGEFYGDDTDDGRPIKVQTMWTRLGPDTARWQQAYSLDGTRWETNWIADYTRVNRTPMSPPCSPV